jgi:hypothetical protein
MRVLTVSFVLLALFGLGSVGFGVAGCGVDPKGLGGTGGGTGSQDGPASGGAGGSIQAPDAASPVDVPIAVDGRADVAASDGRVNDVGASDARASDARADDVAANDASRNDAGGDGGIPCASSATCGAGQVCTTVDGACNSPPGCTAGIACPAVCYGTCRSADTGPACGNTICATGTICCNASCGTCVSPGGGCTKQLCVPPTCAKDSDCEPVADYCTGCDCRALTKGTTLPVCPGPGVRCLVDPCFRKVSTCVNQQCVLAVKG